MLNAHIKNLVTELHGPGAVDFILDYLDNMTREELLEELKQRITWDDVIAMLSTIGD